MKGYIPDTWTKVKKTKKKKIKQVSTSSRTNLETVEKQQKAGLEKFTKSENKDVPSMIAYRLVK